MYSRRKGVKSQFFCSAQAIILRTIAVWALARFVVTAGRIDKNKVKYSCIGVLKAALLCALRVVNEYKCLWNVRHVLIVICTLIKCSPLNIPCIRFALNQSIDGYQSLPRAALGRQPVSHSE